MPSSDRNGRDLTAEDVTNVAYFEEFVGAEDVLKTGRAVLDEKHPSWFDAFMKKNKISDPMEVHLRIAVSNGKVSHVSVPRFHGVPAKKIFLPSWQMKNLTGGSEDLLPLKVRVSLVQLARARTIELLSTDNMLNAAEQLYAHNFIVGLAAVLEGDRIEIRMADGNQLNVKVEKTEPPVAVGMHAGVKTVFCLRSKNAYEPTTTTELVIPATNIDLNNSAGLDLEAEVEEEMR